STSFRPNFSAFSAATSAARWAAKGVLLRLPLKPTAPPEDEHSTSPLVSEMETMVLLNVALMWAMPRLTLRRCFLFLLLATLLAPRRRAGGGPAPPRPPRRPSFDQRISLTPFLPATVLRGPLRVRAFVFVRWPRTGRPRRCRLPR